jgi:tetratricopeptide (TPR) repeat protein
VANHSTLDTPLMPPPLPTVPAPASTPQRRANSRLLIGGVLVALAAAGAGGFVLGNRGQTQSAVTAPPATSPAPTTVAKASTASTVATKPAPVPATGTVDELLTAALSLHVKGQLDDATAVYRAILKKDPSHVLAHYNLGQIAQTRGDNRGAIAEYDKALATDANYSPAIYNAAIAYEAIGDVTKAIEFYRRAIARDPNSAPATFRLGSLLVAQGNPVEGQPLVNHALELDPTLATGQK